MTNFQTSPALARRIAGQAGLVAIFAFASPALADNNSGQNRCARFGADYVAVAGTDGCVKIGGHVRVRISQSGPMAYAPPRDGFRNASMHSGEANNSPFALFEALPR